MSIEHQYLNTIERILARGEHTETRNGDVIRIFGATLTAPVDCVFPLLTTKRVFWRGVVEELLWMLRGDTNAKHLAARGVHIWDEWADEDGNLGPIYGWQWRNWFIDEESGIDQIQELIKGLINDPCGRRHIVSAWNVSELEAMALPPCHMMFQCFVSNDKRLSMQVYQRSADMFLGVPFNIASYALLLRLLALHTGLKPGRMTWLGGDVHIYKNHLEQVTEQVSRAPQPLPTLNIIKLRTNIWDHQFEDFKLVGYEPHPAIKGDVSV